MKFKKINILIITFEVVSFFILFILLHKMYALNQNLYTQSQNKIQMIKVADKLRQSSDDLTHFARTYAITNDKLYYQQYFQTLDIRNGKVARPLMYDSIYWDLEKSIRDARHPKTEKLSLKKMINQLPFTVQEIDKLTNSEANSNELVNLEVMAFEAMAQTPPKQQLAIKLLHSKEYYNAKHKIMNPIDEFIIMLDNRTKNNLMEAQNNINQNFILFLIVSAILIIGNIIVFKFVKKTLNNIIDEEVEKNRRQEEQLIWQSRHAAMGEMISMIAHQWRQPLSIISMGANNILADVELHMIEKKSLISGAEGIIYQTQELSKTINDFRSFFKPDKIAEEISPEDIFSEVISIIGKSLEDSNIEIISEFKSTKKIKTYSRELMQVLINLLKNAQEALVEKREADKKIFVHIVNNEDKVHIAICDNAGGIKKNIQAKIFDPYFSTKDKKSGIGLGLYMSKTIIEKHLNGTLNTYNKDDGACFEIKLPYSIK